MFQIYLFGREVGPALVATDYCKINEALKSVNCKEELGRWGTEICNSAMLCTSYCWGKGGLGKTCGWFRRGYKADWSREWSGRVAGDGGGCAKWKPPRLLRRRTCTGRSGWAGWGDGSRRTCEKSGRVGRWIHGRMNGMQHLGAKREEEGG